MLACTICLSTAGYAIAGLFMAIPFVGACLRCIVNHFKKDDCECECHDHNDAN